MSEDKCKSCGKDAVFSSKSDNILKCGVCSGLYNYMCLSIQPGVAKYINTPNCLWLCDGCCGGKAVLQQILDKLNKLTTQLSEYQLKVDCLDELVQKSESNAPSPKRKSRSSTWSDIAAGNTPLSTPVRIINSVNTAKPTIQKSAKKSKVPVIVVKPKNDKVDKDITKDIQSMFNLKVDPVRSMHKTKGNKFIVECKDDLSIELVKKKLTDKFGTEFEVKRPEPNKPRVKIIGIEQYEGDDETIQYLCVQNPNVIKSRDSLKIIHTNTVKRKNDAGQEHVYTNVVLQTDYDTFVRIQQAKRLLVNWSVCRVYEHIDPQRCFKCNKYGHLTEKCNSDHFVCPKCSKNHKISECQSQAVTCANCVSKNLKNSLKLPTDHFTWSHKCPLLQQRIKSKKKFVDYIQ